MILELASRHWVDGSAAPGIAAKRILRHQPRLTSRPKGDASPPKFAHAAATA
jgi:hypothetical protein